MVDEAETLGIRRLKFTGDEPFTRRELFEFLKYAYAKPGFDYINVVTDLSLAKGRRLEVLKDAVGSGDRLRTHLSIDGILPEGAQQLATNGKKEKLWSKAEFEQM